MVGPTTIDVVPGGRAVIATPTGRLDDDVLPIRLQVVINADVVAEVVDVVEENVDVVRRQIMKPLATHHTHRHAVRKPAPVPADHHHCRPSPVALARHAAEARAHPRAPAATCTSTCSIPVNFHRRRMRRVHTCTSTCSGRPTRCANAARARDRPIATALTSVDTPMTALISTPPARSHSLEIALADFMAFPPRSASRSGRATPSAASSTLPGGGMN